MSQVKPSSKESTPRRALGRGQWFIARITRSSLRTDLLWAALIGCAGALAAYGFRMATIGLHWLFTQHFTSLTRTAADLPWTARVIVPVLGGLLAGLVLYFGMHLHRGQSAKDYMEAIRVGDGHIRARLTLTKSLSSVLSIASGASIGREGPLVQLAAMVGSLPGRWLTMTVERRRLLVACGAAAGIASAYNAPIAGALFVAEIVLGSIAMDNVGPLLFSSVTATIITRDLLGEAPIFGTPAFQLVSHWELLAHVAIGVVAGIAAPLFLGSLKFSERLFGKLPWSAYVKMALGGLVVGILSLIDPRVWGNGYSVVNSILHPTLDEPWLVQTLLVILLLKLVATSATVGSGAVGGVFTPTLFVGAVLGGLMGHAANWMFPGHTAPPAAYALVGMGAFLAATTHAPIMAIIMLFEMTLDYHMVMPLMLGCVLAFYVSSALDADSIYADSLRHKTRPNEA